MIIRACLSFRLFLQPFVWYLYKAEPEKHSYSIRTGENVVEMTNKRCPKGSAKYFLLFVARYLHGITMLHSSRREQKVFILNKI